MQQLIEKGIKIVPKVFKIRRRNGKILDTFIPGPVPGGLGGMRKAEGLDLQYVDPKIRGYDDQLYLAAGQMVQERDVLDYSSGGSDSAELSQKGIITAIALIADPFRHDVTTATLVVVQDAADKVIQGINITGGPSYYSLNNNLLFLKGLSNLNKKLYNLTHQDLATAVGADNDSNQVWFIPFGVFSDYDPFDASAGIPSIDETTLEMEVTFATNQLIGTVAANGTIDDNTDIYVVTYNVIGLPPEYRRRLPIPDFRYDHIPAPVTNSRLDFQVGRVLKRTTIINLAVAANNNEPRNDSNITDVRVLDDHGITTEILPLTRWQVLKGLFQPFQPGVAIDRDGAAAIISEGLVGVAVIDWRQITHNPFGLNLYPRQPRDVHLDLTMATTTGSIHFYNEYYSLPDRTLYDFWMHR